MRPVRSQHRSVEPVKVPLLRAGRVPGGLVHPDPFQSYPPARYPERILVLLLGLVFLVPVYPGLG